MPNPVPATPPHLQERRPLLLACEDEPPIVELLGALAEPLGVELVAVQDGATAVATLLSRRAALMTLDLVLPHGNGFEVLERVRQERALDDLPIVVISALADPAIIRRAYGYGVVDFLCKPFSVDLLDAKLRLFVGLEQRRQELQARQTLLEAVVDEWAVWARTFAHEVRNPLTAISGAAQIVTRPACDQALRLKLGRAIEGEAERVLNLVEEYVERRELPTIKESVDLEGLLHELIDMNLVASPARARIELRIDPALPRVRADRGRLKQVMLNLLLNAVAATEGGGTITLSASPDADGVAFRVSDTGRGIAATDLPRIFDESYSTRPGGGLGLAIARRIVESHAGRVRVESTAGRGSSFTVWLPRSAPSGAPSGSTLRPE